MHNIFIASLVANAALVVLLIWQIFQRKCAEGELDDLQEERDYLVASLAAQQQSTQAGAVIAAAQEAAPLPPYYRDRNDNLFVIHDGLRYYAENGKYYDTHGDLIDDLALGTILGGLFKAANEAKVVPTAPILPPTYLPPDAKKAVEPSVAIRYDDPADNHTP